MPTEFGVRLRAAIDHASTTESAFERKLVGAGLCSKGDISKWVYGTRPLPDITRALAMADALGVDFTWLCTGRGQMLPNRTPPMLVSSGRPPAHDSEPPSVKSDIVRKKDLK